MYVAYNLTCRSQAEGLLKVKVTGSHVRRKYDYTSRKRCKAETWLL